MTSQRAWNLGSEAVEGIMTVICIGVRKCR